MHPKRGFGKFQILNLCKYFLIIGVQPEKNNEMLNTELTNIPDYLCRRPQ